MRRKLTQSEVSATRLHNGAWEVAAGIDALGDGRALGGREGDGKIRELTRPPDPYPQFHPPCGEPVGAASAETGKYPGRSEIENIRAESQLKTHVATLA